MYRPISSDHTLPQTRKKVKREFATSSPPTKNATVSVAYTAAEKPVLFARTKANAIAPIRRAARLPHWGSGGNPRHRHNHPLPLASPRRSQALPRPDHGSPGSDGPQ